MALDPIELQITPRRYGQHRIREGDICDLRYSVILSGEEEVRFVVPAALTQSIDAVHTYCCGIVEEG